MIHLVFAASILAMPSSADTAPGLPDWLAGRWCSEEGAEGQTCEQWQRGTGGMMLGTSQTVKGGKTVSFEFLRIVLDGETPVYLAQPGGKPPVGFRAVAGTDANAGTIAFAKPDHDYPQRIQYQVRGDTLTAEISLADGSKPMRWVFTRVR